MHGGVGGGGSRGPPYSDYCRQKSMTKGLTRTEIFSVVNDYIGVDDGYLCDFTYQSHSEFYPYYCGLDIDPLVLSGSTRGRFIRILEEATPADQVKILRGVLKKCPPESRTRRTESRAREIEGLISRLENRAGVRAMSPQITSEVVERALNDAETLIATNGATSGVDRVHTTLHGYVKAVCEKAKIGYGDDPSLTDLFKLLRERHPCFSDLGPREGDLHQVLRALGSIIAVLNPVRNRASVAHPNDTLLKEPEAMLVINAARTILHYLDSKLR